MSDRASSKGHGMSGPDYLSPDWAVKWINRKIMGRLSGFFRGRLLDIGCGEKPYKEIIDPYLEHYIGLEHPGTLHKNSAIDIYGDGLDLPFQKEVFDTVMAFAVLEHVPEPGRMLAEIHRVLKHYGSVILAVPLMWGIHEEPKDFYRFTRYGLKYLLEKEGFELLVLEATTGFWTMAGLRFGYYLSRFRGEWVGYLLIPLIPVVHIVVSLLDRIHRVDTDTISYIVVGRKK